MSSSSQILQSATFAAAAPAFGPARAGAALRDAALRALKLAAQWRARARERRALAAMVDRELRDIGVTRAEIWAETEKPFWRS